MLELNFFWVHFYFNKLHTYTMYTCTLIKTGFEAWNWWGISVGNLNFARDISGGGHCVQQVQQELLMNEQKMQSSFKLFVVVYNIFCKSPINAMLQTLLFIGECTVYHTLYSLRYMMCYQLKMLLLYYPGINFIVLVDFMIVVLIQDVLCTSFRSVTLLVVQNIKLKEI